MDNNNREKAEENNILNAKEKSKTRQFAWLRKMNLQHDPSSICYLFKAIFANSSCHPFQKEYKTDEVIKRKTHITVQCHP